jgi:hypothetical protein
MKLRRKLCVDDWVEVRSKEEILRTLDSDSQLDGMPFMPEMFAFCGQRFQVYKRAHKTCDTVFPVRGRRVDRTVHLATRCDGHAHDGCQAGCLIFWKEAWLKPANRAASKDATVVIGSRSTDSAEHAPGCTESDVFARAKSIAAHSGAALYACQATQLPYATTDLQWWDVRQYVEDYWSGNVGLWRIICGAVYSLYYAVSKSGVGLERGMRRFYDTFHPLWRGTPWPRKTGTIPEGQRTPARTLNLQPGELVRIKSHEEILKTLDTSSKNRGLYWDAEEVPYCGGTYPVLRRVTKIIDERTGRMQELKTHCVILDSVTCESRYSGCRLFCPRSIYSYWRETWLERVQPSGLPSEGSTIQIENTR